MLHGAPAQAAVGPTLLLLHSKTVGEVRPSFAKSSQSPERQKRAYSAAKVSRLAYLLPPGKGRVLKEPEDSLLTIFITPQQR